MINPKKNMCYTQKTLVFTIKAAYPVGYCTQIGYDLASKYQAGRKKLALLAGAGKNVSQCGIPEYKCASPLKLRNDRLE